MSKGIFIMQSTKAKATCGCVYVWLVVVGGWVVM